MLYKQTQITTYDLESHNYLKGGLPTVVLCVLTGSSIQQNASTAILNSDVRQLLLQKRHPILTIERNKGHSLQIHFWIHNS